MHLQDHHASGLASVVFSGSRECPSRHFTSPLHPVNPRLIGLTAPRLDGCELTVGIMTYLRQGSYG